MRCPILPLLLGLSEASSDAIGSGKAADFYIRDLPGVDPSTVLPEMHSGLLEVGTRLGLGEAGLFFWHVRAKNDSKKTIIWFNGGPGCSSMDGNLLELGPLRFDEHSKLLKTSPGAWSETSNLLFIDQPFGTGYSDPNSGEFAHTLEIAADAVVEFIDEYADVFPEIAATDIFLAGESFAGQYVPYIWKALNKRADVMDKINRISGLILGNPWVDPANQYLSYVPFIKEKGLVSDSLFGDLDEMQARCVSALQEKVVISSPECDQISSFVLHMSSKEHGKCFNVYKHSELSPYPECGAEWPAAVPLMTEWLSREDVRKALHGPLDSSKRWNECSTPVREHLYTDSADPAVHLLPEILEHIPVMIMIGDLDYICNGQGLDRMVRNLAWNGAPAGFGLDEELEHFPFGTLQSGRNLSIAHVTKGSHMLPVDDLEVSRDLMMHFTGIQSLRLNVSRPEEHGQKPDAHPGSGTDSSSGSGPDTNPGSSGSSPSQDEIDDAVSRAYAKAGVLALIIVLVVLVVLACVWWWRGEGLSGKGLIQALLQTSTRFKGTRKKDQYFPLRNLGRRPDVILEEDEEDVV